jgi:hypothetical protein
LTRAAHHRAVAESKPPDNRTTARGAIVLLLTRGGRSQSSRRLGWCVDAFQRDAADVGQGPAEKPVSGAGELGRIIG